MIASSRPPRPRRSTGEGGVRSRERRLDYRRSVSAPGRHPETWFRSLSGRYGTDISASQVLASVTIIVIALITVQPRTPLVLILLILNCAFVALRHVPSSVLSTPNRIVLLGLGAIAAAAIDATSTAGIGSVFGFFIAGHAGFRLGFGRALAMAAGTSVLCAGVLLIPIGDGHTFTPWYVGAASGAAVLAGMLSRSRQEALVAALEAAESAERAAQAEARELVLAERGRIARDVHDVLAHSLAGINMQLEMADALMDAGRTEQARDATRRAQSMVRESLVEAQRTVRTLREGSLPLVETLTAMLAPTGAVPRVSGQVRELDTTLAQTLVRVAQEAITNAHKHAPGAAIAVSLDYQPASVSIEIVNDPPAQAARPLADTGSGMGLVGMRERVSLAGGTLTAHPVAAQPVTAQLVVGQSAIGQPVPEGGQAGWRVHAEIPT